MCSATIFPKSWFWQAHCVYELKDKSFVWSIPIMKCSFNNLSTQLVEAVICTVWCSLTRSTLILKCQFYSRLYWKKHNGKEKMSPLIFLSSSLALILFRITLTGVDSTRIFPQWSRCAHFFLENINSPVKCKFFNYVEEEEENRKSLLADPAVLSLSRISQH